MLSVSKTMNILMAEGLIKNWRMTRQDARLYDDAPPLFEKIISITPVEGVPLLQVGNEVFGNKAMLYFYCNNEHSAKAVVNALLQHGGKPSMRWCPDDPARFDMPVSYFKGCRWWE